MDKMQPQEWAQVGDAFMRVLDTETALRPGVLEALEPAVRAEVESLLQAHEQAGEFLKPLSEAPLPAAKTYRAGEKIGDFVILKSLGEGALAQVYLAQQISLGRLVALKVSKCEGYEGQILAPLEHDHIVRVFSETFDEGTRERHLCIQFVMGTTLERVLSQRRELDGEELLNSIAALSSEETYWDPKAHRDRQTLAGLSGVETVLWYGVRLSEALAYAHRRGVLHLDIKPANILLNSYGRPMLSDFNVSLQKRQGAPSQKIRGGTYRYMPPEQEAWFQKPEGPPIDERADIFSLGVVLKEMLAKVAPGSGPAHQALERILNRCTSANPDERFASAGDLSKALLGCFEFHKVEDELPAPGPLVRLTEKYPLTVLILGMLLPQLLGAAINIAHNAIRIVGHLNVVQQDFFLRLCAFYNPLGFGIIMCLLIAPIQRNVIGWKKARTTGLSQDDQATLRQRFLRYPLRVLLCVMAGWLIGAFFFPIALDLGTGPIDKKIYVHFFISLTVSGMVALAYSFLTTQFLILRVFYPPLLAGLASPRKTARDELQKNGFTLKYFHFSAAFIPLVVAGFLVAVGPESLSGPNYTIYRILIASLLGLGMVGLALAFRAQTIVAETLRAIQRRD